MRGKSTQLLVWDEVPHYQIIMRRTKNICLVGEPGVGKTAIVEGLAQRMVEKFEGKCRKNDTLMLDIGAVVAGTKCQCWVRTHEENLGRSISWTNVILLSMSYTLTLDFPGGQKVSIDANILKPALARGNPVWGNYMMIPKLIYWKRHDHRTSFCLSSC